MLTHLRHWMLASRPRRWAAASLGAAMLLGGVALTANTLLRPTPPDPNTASHEQIIAFLTEDYVRLGSAGREAFLRGLVDRMIGMNASERRAFDERWRASGGERRLRRQIDTQVHMVLVRRLAEEYDRLPPEARGPFLDRILVMIEVMGPGAQRFMGWLDSNPMDEAMRDPGQFHQDLNPFQRELIMGTSAEERAGLVRLGGDLLERARRYTQR